MTSTDLIYAAKHRTLENMKSFKTKREGEKNNLFIKGTPDNLTDLETLSVPPKHIKLQVILSLNFTPIFQLKTQYKKIYILTELIIIKKNKTSTSLSPQQNLANVLIFVLKKKKV